MNSKKDLPINFDETVSEVAAILAKGWLRLRATRREYDSNSYMPSSIESSPLSEKSLDFLIPEALRPIIDK